MVQGSVSPYRYILVAILIGFFSVILHYSLEFGVTTGQETAGLLAVEEAVDFETAETQMSFFSMQNPLAWFMFGAWFALLLFFILSIAAEHGRKR